jgi:hypothetical protein
MSASKQFSNKLDELWRRRTASLRSHVIPQGVGKPLTFSKPVRQKFVNELLDDASNILIHRDARSALTQITASRHLKHIQGRGLGKRAENMLRWAESALSGPIVYGFWKGRRCLYIGKGGSWRRLKSYEKSAYLLQATRVKVFCITTKSNLSKAECLATHLFDPRDKKMKPAKVKWGKKCPICREHDFVRHQVHNLFKLK